ncbi:MAG: sigma-70 family RNA polymerase sigma factor [Verrucomicrobiota bacterium]|nr:sigma-70 family RNA polymerase sigma factor [Verrucomicrobiota bacterium]
MSSEISSGPTRAGDIFATTHWTVVLAGGRKHTPQSDAALEQLCKTYWFPLYAYVRRRGHTKEDAEDLTQAFFAGFLGKNYLENLSNERGRFRAFLLASLKHFLANEWDKSQRQKRGGGAAHLSLDWQTADTQFQIAAHTASPDQEFDREWAVALLAKVIQRLEVECENAGQAQQFKELKIFLSAGKGVVPYADAVKILNMEEGAIRVAAHRLRKRYRQLLSDEIAQTVADPAQVEEEMRALFAAFCG